MSTTSLQNHPSVEELFKHVDTIPLALFEHLDFSFLTDFPVFAPDPQGRTRDHEPPELLKGVLYCFSREIYSPEKIARELRDELFYRQCGFDSPPSHQPIRRFLTDVALVVDDFLAKQFRWDVVAKLVNYRPYSGYHIEHCMDQISYFL